MKHQKKMKCQKNFRTQKSSELNKSQNSINVKIKLILRAR